MCCAVSLTAFLHLSTDSIEVSAFLDVLDAFSAISEIALPISVIAVAVCDN